MFNLDLIRSPKATSNAPFTAESNKMPSIVPDKSGLVTDNMLLKQLQAQQQHNHAQVEYIKPQQT